MTMKELFVDDFINTLKFAVPGMLLFYGCNSLQRFKWAIGAILLMNALLALQVVKVMPLSQITDGYALEQSAIRMLDRDIGYYRTDLAILLSGAAWSVYIFRLMVNRTSLSLLGLAVSFMMLFAVGLTGSRIGMVGWAVVAFFLAYYRWRRFFVFAPALVLVVVALVPSVQERMMQGINGAGRDNNAAESVVTVAGGDVNLTSVTSGRTTVWPVIIEGIGEAPLLGHGRRAMQRTGISTYLAEAYGQIFPHPHNAYLQLLLDNGWLLSLPVFWFFLLMLKYSFSLFRDNSNLTYVVTGGICLSFLLSQLIGAIGSQSFYPAAGTVSLWCVLGVMLRVHCERRRLARLPVAARESSNPDIWAISSTAVPGNRTGTPALAGA